MEKEWSKLNSTARADGGIGCWDLTTVREARDAVSEAKRKGEEIHLCDVFGMYVEKGSELAPDHPERRFKGRVCLRGNNLKDQNYEWAIFDEASSSPATMQAGKVCDAYGLQPGYNIEVADAEGAYTQTVVKGPKTWIRLPREQQPSDWAKFHDPVCLCILNLYGHPEAGKYWQDYCEEHMFAAGFERIEDWQSYYFHPVHKTFLVIYVDDFKMSGPTDGLRKSWELIRARIKTDAPADISVSKYLGCEYRCFEIDGVRFLE